MHGMGDPKTCKIASLVKQNSTVAKFRFELANREVSFFFLDLFREGSPKTQNEWIEGCDPSSLVQS